MSLHVSPILAAMPPSPQTNTDALCAAEKMDEGEGTQGMLRMGGEIAEENLA